jgi:hypothetical protein
MFEEINPAAFWEKKQIIKVENNRKRTRHHHRSQLTHSNREVEAHDGGSLVPGTMVSPNKRYRGSYIW